MIAVWLGAGFVLSVIAVIAWLNPDQGDGQWLLIAPAFFLWALFLKRLVRGARGDWKKRGAR